MNWYVEKIISLISENKCDYDGYCIFLEAYAWFDKNKIEIEVSDCSDNVFGRKCGFDYLKFDVYAENAYPWVSVAVRYLDEEGQEQNEEP